MAMLKSASRMNSVGRGPFDAEKQMTARIRFEDKPIHLNASNIQKLIPPQGGNSVMDVMQNNIDDMLARRKHIFFGSIFDSDN